MGLPMWRDPDEIAAEEAAAKLDRAAANRRSAIRRETTVRPGRQSPNSASSNRSAYERRSEALRRTRALLDQDEQQLDQEINQVEAQLEVLRTERLLQRARLGRERLGRIRDGAQQRTDNALLRDAMDLLNQTRHTDDEEETNTAETHESTQPLRSSNLRFEVLNSAQTRATSPSQHRSSFRPVMPSPPLSTSSNDRSRLVPDGPIDSAENLTPGFAPAHGPYGDSPQLPESTGRTMHHHTSHREVTALETPPPEQWGPDPPFPPMRRVNHISPRVPGQSRSGIDGLGDRRRSPSPLSEFPEEERWSNLLSTLDNMENDRSSASTSFASRADSASNSHRSSQNTAATTMSFGEISQADDACDLDLVPGITEEDAREIRERHRRTPARVLPPMTGERGLRLHDARMRARLHEMNMIQNLLERSHHQELPAEWWATVGVTPDMLQENS